MFLPCIVRSLGLAGLLGVSVVMASGCSGSRAHSPTPVASREAVEAALASWQKGLKPDAVAAGSTPIHVSDFQWQAGQALAGFDNLAEAPDESDGFKRFSVNLKLKGAKADTKTRYVVVGRDPLWVYRAEDYARLLNMDDSPRPAAKRRGR